VETADDWSRTTHVHNQFIQPTLQNIQANRTREQLKHSDRLRATRKTNAHLSWSPNNYKTTGLWITRVQCNYALIGAEIPWEHFPRNILARMAATSRGVGAMESEEQHDTWTNGQNRCTAADRRPTNQVSAWQAERGSCPTRRHHERFQRGGRGGGSWHPRALALAPSCPTPVKMMGC